MYGFHRYWTSIRSRVGVVAFAAVAGALPVRGADSTLDAIKKQGSLRCGVSQGLPGFSSPEASGKWVGLDVDVCRAIAAAVLTDADKVKYTPLSAKERFTALQSGEIDVLSRNTTWTLVRDASLGVDFAGVTYYDGQGFMVKKASGVTSVNKLNGATICVQTGTTTELNIADYFRAHDLKYKLLVFEKADEVVAAYDGGRCDVFSTDQSGLYSQRIKLKKPDDHVVLPEIISKEPLGPAVRHGDGQWEDIVRWAIYAMLTAEELGLTTANVDGEKANNKNPDVRRFLGLEGDIGAGLGLDKEWAYRIVKQVGSYAESFDRNLGPKTPLGIARGANKLWTAGGLQYPMPFR